MIVKNKLGYIKDRRFMRQGFEVFKVRIILKYKS